MNQSRKRVRRILTLLLFFSLSSCIQLEVSPFDSSQGQFPGWLGALFPDTACHTFQAYSFGAKSFVSYNTCSSSWQLNTYTATNILQKVAKTNSGFVALDNTTTNLYSSTNSLTWSSSAASADFATGTAAGARVAACGNTVVIAYVNGGGSAVDTVRSSDGGATFSPVVTALTGTTLWDLTCENDIFHLSGGSIATNIYRRSLDGGATWLTPSSDPDLFGIPLRSVAVNGSVVLGHYQSTSPTLSRSLDGGASWTDLGSTIFGAYFYPITYASNYFLAPYTSAPNCIFRRSNDNGTTWDETVTAPCVTAEEIHKIKGIGSIIVASGQAYVSPIYEPLIFISNDGSGTWSRPTLPAGTTANLGELIVY